MYIDEDEECGDFLGIIKTNFHYVGTTVEEPSLGLNWIEERDILHTGVLVVGRVIAAVRMGQMENIRWVILWEEGIPNPVVEFPPFPFPPPP